MKAAEDAIEEAVIAASRENDVRGVITGWIVIASTTDIVGDDTVSGIALIYPGGSMPWTQALGLIEAARIRTHEEFRRGDA
jgi:hypothetical protein